MGRDIEGKLTQTTSTEAESDQGKVGVIVDRTLSRGEWEKYRQTKRGLHPRHVQLMA